MPHAPCRLERGFYVEARNPSRQRASVASILPRMEQLNESHGGGMLGFLEVPPRKSSLTDERIHQVKRRESSLTCPRRSPGFYRAGFAGVPVGHHRTPGVDRDSVDRIWETTTTGEPGRIRLQLKNRDHQCAVRDIYPIAIPVLWP